MARYFYCVEETVSIALSIPSWGYSVHGHDVRVRICVGSRARFNIDVIRGMLREALHLFDHKLLNDVLGGEALIEDMLEHVISLFQNKLPNNMWIEYAEGRIPGAIIRVVPNS